MRNVVLDLEGHNNRLILRPGSRLSDVKIYIRGSGHVLDVGQGCRFSGELWFEDSGCTIKLGDRTSVYGAHLAVTECGSAIEIGNNCLFSHGIEIRTGDSHSIIDATTGARINEPGNVQIADHVWIGANVTVLKGVTIGQDSVVGTGAIVTKAIPPGVVAAGVPARVIRRNVNWTAERTSRGPT